MGSRNSLSYFLMTILLAACSGCATGGSSGIAEDSILNFSEIAGVTAGSANGKDRQLLFSYVGRAGSEYLLSVPLKDGMHPASPFEYAGSDRAFAPDLKSTISKTQIEAVLLAAGKVATREINPAERAAVKGQETEYARCTDNVGQLVAFAYLSLPDGGILPVEFKFDHEKSLERTAENAIIVLIPKTRERPAGDVTSSRVQGALLAPLAVVGEGLVVVAKAAMILVIAPVYLVWRIFNPGGLDLH